MALEAGEHLLLLLKACERTWRHSVVLDVADGVHHHLLTPNRAMRRADLSSDNISAMRPWDGTMLPRGLTRAQVFLDVDSEDGKFTELGNNTPPVRRRVRTKSPQLPPPIQDKDDVEPDRKDRPKKKEPLRPVEVKAVADGEGWYVFSGLGACLTGALIELSVGEGVVLGDTVLFQKGSAVVMAVWCKAENVAARFRDLRVRASGHPATRFEKLDDIYAEPDDAPRKKPETATKDVQADVDLRILPVHFERDGRRFRRLQECEPECEEDEFTDWPLQGDRSMSAAARGLRRKDQSWLQHHENWLKHSGVRPNDRSTHEHRVLCASLRHFTTYDQVCTVNLAGCEAINARRELIEYAHRTTPEQPRREGSEDVLGHEESEGGTLIDPKRISCVAAKQSQRAKILEATLKSKEAEAAWRRRDGKGDKGEGKGNKAPGASAGTVIA